MSTKSPTHLKSIGQPAILLSKGGDYHVGIKLLWVGLTILTAFQVVFPLPAGEIVGAILMILGCGLFLLDK